jgi:arginine-tRNA-protein transferase
MRPDQPPVTSLETLAFYASPPTPCSYLPGRDSVSIFADPTARLSSEIYTELARYGFRRSGQHVYRPACPACKACIPVRIPVADFAMTRSERRIWLRNAGVTVTEKPPIFDAAHFQLYRRYIGTRHAGGGMDDPDPLKFMDFLTSPWCDTRFCEFRDAGGLLAVAVIDRLRDAWSAVYTFFEPDLTSRSLGTYAILWEIEAARRAGRSYLYLGYWIEGCRKMAYKGRFRPLEHYQQGRWMPLGHGML